MQIDVSMTFEAAMARLEEIVRLLESGNAPLDVSLALYEEGVALVRLCTSRLDNAQQRVKILTFAEDGSASEQDMTGGASNAVHGTGN